jgi:Fe2+ or Zn2+ uptake regulation protein
VFATFSEKGVLEKCTSSNGVAIYSKDTDKKSHSHFKCNDCETIIKLTELPKIYLDALQKIKLKPLMYYLEGSY